MTESMLASFRSPAGQRLVFLSPPRPLRWADARLPSRASSRTCQALARPGFSASTDRRSASMRLTTFREAASQKNGLYFGTQDSREPKFCPRHFFADDTYSLEPIQ